MSQVPINQLIRPHLSLSLSIPDRSLDIKIQLKHHSHRMWRRRRNNPNPVAKGIITLDQLFNTLDFLLRR
jgi:hypothetical protein